MTETFYGYIDTTQDVLLIFEGCRRGLLPRVNRRLQEKERKLIRSGSVFVFDERESGVKRWTDGLVWSPSRILGNFLVYRELEKRNGEKRMSISDHRQRSYSVDVSSTVSAAGGGFLTDRAKEKRLVGSLSDVYNFRIDGLIKKTMSIVVNGSTQHLISYYHPQDIIENKLRTPSSVPELTSLEISPELLVKQNFRIPPFVEPTFDQIANDSPGGATGTTALNLRYHSQPQYQPYQPQPQQHQQHQQQYQPYPQYQKPSNTGTSNRGSNTGSPLRSMSVGSLNSLRQESLLYTDNQQQQQQQQPMNGLATYDSFNGNSSVPTDNNDKSSRIYTMYYQPQDQLQQQQQQQQLQQHLSSPQLQMHSISNGTMSSVYSTMSATTPSPTSMRYDPPPNTYERTHTHHHPEQQRYTNTATPSPNPQLGHLLNPVHPLNSTNPSSASLPPNDLSPHHEVKMESLDQPIFYGNRSSPLSTAHTSRLI